MSPRARQARLEHLSRKNEAVIVSDRSFFSRFPDRRHRIRLASAHEAEIHDLMCGHGAATERNQITGEVKGRELALAKSRVGEEGPVSPFSLKFVKLGEDEDGDDVGACIVVPDLEGEPVVANAANWKRKEPRTVRAFRSAFHEALEQFGELRAVMGDGPTVRMVALHRVRDAFRRFYATGEDEEKAKGAVRVAWHRALQEGSQRGIALTGAWGGEEWGWMP